ncbi:hypothetical protein IQ268_18710 [Oculatella sp. LEGE 06141]|nr:hypothetical protein [Oculatella sp. LEGE 06141]
MASTPPGMVFSKNCNYPITPLPASSDRFFSDPYSYHGMSINVICSVT